MGPLIPVALAIAAWACSPRPVDEDPTITDATRGSKDGGVSPPDGSSYKDADTKSGDGSYVELPRTPDSFVSDAADTASPGDVPVAVDQKVETPPDVIPVTPKYCEPQVTLQAGCGITEVAAGGDVSCLIKSGAVYCAGKITSSTDPSTPLFTSTTFVEIPSLAGATHIAVGGAHLCAIMPGNTVKCLGQDIWGQLGDGTTQDASTTVLVGGAEKVAAISLGGFHSLGLNTSGQPYAWGLNAGGQLGIAAMPLKSSVPQAITLPASTYAISISAGALHSVAALSDGTVLAWGNNVLVPLGVGATGKVLTPAVMQNSKSAIRVAAGADFTLVLDQACMISSVGIGTLGQLGLGTTSDATTLTPIPSLAGVAAPVAGGQHACAVTQAGALFCWGENNFGDPIKTPSPVAGVPSVVQASLGANHSIALTASCQVFVWGKNNAGQLGMGNTTDAPSPKSISLN